MLCCDVTVVIPTYNGAEFIADALRSVSAQSCAPTEIVVVDDCSADETLLVVEQARAETSVPIRVICLGDNSGGPARPMNVGVAAAKTEFLAMLDQDDLMAPDRIRMSLAAARQNPEASLILGDFVLFRDGAEIDGSAGTAVHREVSELKYEGEPAAARLFGDEWRCTFFRNSSIQRSCSNHFFRKSVWQRAGGYREGARFAADFDFVVRAFGDGVVWLRERQFLKRVHGANACPPRDVMDGVLWELQWELVRLTRSAALRREFLNLTLCRLHRMRWTGRYRDARRAVWPLIRLGRPIAGGVEASKTLVAEGLTAAKAWFGRSLAHSE